MIITAQQLAARLHYREYGDHITKQDRIDANDSGLVIVTGHSDDNVELGGAINDEVGANDGTTFILTSSGPVGLNLQKELRDMNYMPEDAFFREVSEKIAAHQHGKKIKALYGESEYTWSFETDVPHEAFDILDGDEKFCRGMIIRLDDLKAPEPVDVTAIVERAERAESLACSVLESLKLTPHSLLVVKTGDVMPEHAAHEVIKTLQRVVPENVTIVFSASDLQLDMLDETKMRAAGWVRTDAQQQRTEVVQDADSYGGILPISVAMEAVIRARPGDADSQSDASAS